MDESKKRDRYGRIYEQLKGLLAECDDPTARMATVVAVLHHKMPCFFWTGFYLLKDGRLIVGPYQGPVACQELEKDKGVCWAGVNRKEPVIVPDVEKFPGHIACDSRSRSEIVIPLMDGDAVLGVLDVDSKALNTFDEADAEGLGKIVKLLLSS
jgi:GAF domain-containing protein